MSNEKKPVSIENLPEYLKSQRENNVSSQNVHDGEGAPVVGMGQIVVPKEESSIMKWAEKLVLAVVLFVGFGIGSMIAYDVTTPQQFVVIMDSSNGISAIPTIVSDSGGEMIDVKQNEDSTYEVEISTYKTKRSFLAWLRENKDVKNVRLKTSS